MKKLLFIIVLTISPLLTVYSQAGLKVSKGPDLTGLKKISISDLDNEAKANLNLTNIDVYNNAGQEITLNEMQKLMSTGKFLPHLYVNQNNEVKAMVLKETTKRELLAAIKNNTSDQNSLVGNKATTFKVTDLEGNFYDLEALNDKVVVLNFWFVACKPCIKEMPELNELVEKYKNEDVVFLAMAMDKEGALKKFIEDNRFDYSIISGRNTIAKYGINVFPTHIVIGKDGVIELFTQGLDQFTVVSLDDKIKTLIK